MFKSGKEQLIAKVNNRIQISLTKYNQYQNNMYPSNSYGEVIENALEKKVSEMVSYVMEEAIAELINDIYSHEEFEQDLGLNE